MLLPAINELLLLLLLLLLIDPTWMNNWVEGGHQPLWPETYARMPPEVQRIMVGRHGRDRRDMYEWQAVQKPSL